MVQWLIMLTALDEFSLYVSSGSELLVNPVLGDPYPLWTPPAPEHMWHTISLTNTHEYK